MPYIKTSQLISEKPKKEFPYRIDLKLSDVKKQLKLKMIEK